MQARTRIDTMTLAGLAILALFAFNIVSSLMRERLDSASLAFPSRSQAPATPAPETAVSVANESATNPASDPAWHAVVAPPYDNYVLTQGLHGQSYGHLAIDIAAGHGAAIRSIINGTVTGRGYDQWGNTYIQIENDNYAVLYLHGEYTLDIGAPVAAGEPIGTESNIGYTLDYYGRSCAGRDCGYHTHLNLFDKRLGTNIDPLTLIPAGR